MGGIFEVLFCSPKKGEPLFNPVCYVVLGEHCIKDGVNLLTPQMVESELDSNIDYLVGEL